jgi:ABC-type transport system involved in multi-copper enzyme maturation permease subunit
MVRNSILVKKLKPIGSTVILELRLQTKKFIIFSLVSVLLFLLTSVLPYVVNPNFSIFPNIADYMQNGVTFYFFIIILSIGSFFSGIICTEYNNKTGMTIFPLISKSQFLIGRLIANYLIVVGISFIYYMCIGLYTYYFYGGPILYTLYISFGFLLLYLLALAGITTFLSSLMPSPILVFVIIAGLLLGGSLIIDPMLALLSSFIEPLFSLSYLFNIVRYSLYPNFESIDRLLESLKIWLFPSSTGALVTLIIVIITSIPSAYQIFKRREL